MQGFHPQKHKTQVKNYTDGGIVRGPGTGTSDDVLATVPNGGYVMPADSTQALGFKPGMRQRSARGDGAALGFKPRMREAMLSDGELVLTPEQVEAAGGVEALEKFREATHTPVPDQNIPGEPKFFFANGGLDEKKQVIGAPASPAATSIGAPATTTNPAAPKPNTGSVVDQIPNSAPAGWTGGKGERVTGTDFTRNVSNTMNALAPVGGALAPAVSGFMKAGSTVARVASASPVVDKALSYGIPAIGLSALQNAAKPDETPSPAVVPRAAGFTPQARPGAPVASGMPEKPGTPAAQTNMQSTAPQPQAQGFVPGVYQHGRGQYSDNAAGMGFKPGFTGQPNAQNMAAADNLAQRSAARGFTPRAQEVQPQAPQAVIPQDTGGYGLLDKNRIALRNAMIDANQGDAGGKTMVKSLLQQQAAAPGQQIERDRLAADVAAGTENRALKAENMRSDRGFRAVQLANETARTGLESQRVASDIEARGFEVSQARRLQRLQDEYLSATDDVERAVAMRKMQALSGKTQPVDDYMSISGGEALDKMGTPYKNPDLIVNRRTGEVVDVGAPKRTERMLNDIAILKRNPSLADKFDSFYGKGSAAKVLSKS